MNSLKFYTRYIFYTQGTAPFLDGTFKLQSQLEDASKVDNCEVMDEVFKLVGFGDCFEDGNVVNVFARFVDYCVGNSIPITLAEFQYWKNSNAREFTSGKDVNPIQLNVVEGTPNYPYTYAAKMYLAAMFFYNTMNAKYNLAHSNNQSTAQTVLSDDGELGKAVRKSIKSGKWNRYLNKYLKDNFIIKYSDDSVAAVESDIYTSDPNTIFLPTGSFCGLSKVEVLQTFKSIVLELYQGVLYKGCVSINFRNYFAQLGDSFGNALMYTEEAGSETMLALEVLRRRCQVSAIDKIMGDVFNIGAVEFIDGDTMLVGGCSEKIFVLTAFSYIYTEPKFLNSILSHLREFENLYELNTPDIWKIIVGNRTPANGKYNHILESNIL